MAPLCRWLCRYGHLAAVYVPVGSERADLAGAWAHAKGGYRITAQDMADLGLPGVGADRLRELLQAGPVPDVHTYLEVMNADGAFPVDATLPWSAGRAGLPINTAFQMGSPMRLAITGNPAWTAPVRGEELYTEKERRTAEFCGADRPRREAFIQALSLWLHAAAR